MNVLVVDMGLQKKKKKQYTCPYADVCAHAKEKKCDMFTLKCEPTYVKPYITQKTSFVNIQTGQPVVVLSEEEALAKALGCVRNVQIVQF